MSMRKHSEEYGHLEQAIAALEAQRIILGDAVVDAALGSMQQRLAELEESECIPTLTFEGERKLVTIMFADISGFTALSETLDPEAVRELMNACFNHLVPIVQKYEGTVDKFIGDEIMALFGAPVAHENDPEHALRAALEMTETLVAFNKDRGTNLGMHIGINTGLVIAGGIGSEGRQQYSVMGDAVNLAARLEDASKRGEIFVGPDTYRLTAPLFDFEPLTPVQVKGKAKPVAVYRLRATRAVRGKVRGIEGLHSSMVGRDDELEQLQAAMCALQGGRGGVISVIAEAGLGKSRLVAEARQISPTNLTWVEGRALSYTEGMGYWIVRDMLRGLLGVEADTHLKEISAALRASIEKVMPDRDSGDVWPYLAHLLDLPLEEMIAERIAQFDPQALQERILRAFASYVRARSKQPLVLVWEDLHWADGSSLNLLETLLPLTAELPLLLLFVFRPEEGGAWGFHQRTVRAHVKTYEAIQLQPLDRSESARLVQSLLKIENLPDQTRTLILDKAEGNPLFLEEMLRSLIDAGMVLLQAGMSVATSAIHELKAIDVPDTVQGVIASRIDRLPPKDKYTLQTAAIIGRIFQRQVLKHLLDQEQAGNHLDASLDELRGRSFIRLRTALTRRAISADQEYIFKHILTQEMAYNSMLIAQRKVLHKAVGKSIEALFPERLDELAATLAHHFHLASDWERASTYYLAAAQRAKAMYSNAEAIDLYSAALDLEDHLGESERARAKYAALTGRAAVLAHIGRTDAEAKDLEALRILGRPEAKTAERAEIALLCSDHACRTGQFEQALQEAKDGRTLYATLNDKHGEGRALGALGAVLNHLGNLEEAREMLREALEVLREVGDRALEARIRKGLGTTHARLGSLDQAIEQYTDAIAIYRDLEDQSGESEILGNLGSLHYLQADYERATTSFSEAQKLFHSLGNVRNEAKCLNNLGMCNAALGNYESARRHHEDALRLYMEVGDEASEANALSNLGIAREALAVGGDPAFEWRPLEQSSLLDEAIENHRRALDIYERNGDQVGQRRSQFNLGCVFITKGYLEEALAYLSEALNAARDLGLKPLAGRALAAMSRAHLLLAGLPDALACSSEAVSMLDDTSASEVDEIRFAHYRVLTACEKNAEAAVELRLARYATMEKASRIRDRTARGLFLSAYGRLFEVPDASST